MRFSEQKKDTTSIAFFIVLCFVLFCILIIIPIVMLIYGYNLGNYKTLAKEYIRTMQIYCGVALLALAAFLYIVYHYLERNKLTRLKDGIKNDICAEVKQQIKKELLDASAKEIIRSGLDQLLDQQISKSTGDKVNNFFSEQKKETIDSIETIKRGIFEELNAIKDEAQRKLDEINKKEEDRKQ